jgi:hypothetical protein
VRRQALLLLARLLAKPLALVRGLGLVLVLVLLDALSGLGLQEKVLEIHLAVHDLATENMMV